MEPVPPRVRLVRSQSESAAFRNKNNVMKPEVLNRFVAIKAIPIKVIPMSQSECYLTKIKSCFQLFKLHLYNNHKLAVVIGILSILAGVGGLVFSLGWSSVVSWCLITGGATLVCGTIYHSSSVALNCGLCRTNHQIEESDCELDTPQ